MSNTIGFSNFRKFINFPEQELGNITILVGGNNAGKSTLVKAMLLMRDFLKSRIERNNDAGINDIFKFRPQFSFDTEHVNIGDYYRAFCRQSPQKAEEISFTMKIDKYRFDVNIRGERKTGVIPEVSTISVFDENNAADFTFDFLRNKMFANFNHQTNSINDKDIEETTNLQMRIAEVSTRLDGLKKVLLESKDLEKISAIKVEIERSQWELNRMRSELKKKEKKSVNDNFHIKVYGEKSINLYFYNGLEVGRLMIPELIRGFARFAADGIKENRRSKVYKDEKSGRTFLGGKAVKIAEIADAIETALNKQVIEYIYAHSVYQDSVYANCANSSDYTKRTIHEFYTSRISKGDEEFSLIEKWLKEFKIGDSFKVASYKGDNYSLVIYDKDNPEITNVRQKGYPGGIDLADKGMGSIQVVILLLRIATLIRKYKGQQLTVLLEEPEQNLHPVLQSKLADLIFEVNKNFGLRFVIETHSEYLVRHSQVIAASQMYEEGIALSEVNESIKVLYISQERGVVDMLFSNNAKFQDSFDEGFFDQAARESLTISRLERVYKNK